MKRRRTATIIILCVLGTFLLRAAAAFCAVGVFFHVFYARYDTLCPTDLTVADIRSETEAVTFPSGENELSGLLVGTGSKGVIVVVHGMRSGMDAHFAEADYFAENGYTVLLYDATGTRTSGGSSRESVSYARDDLDAALDYLETTPLCDLPVYLYGHSSGGYAVATVLDRADAAAVLCAFDDPIDTMCDTAAQYVGFLVQPQRPFLKLWNRIHAGSDANESASACINTSDTPILIVDASEDAVIPPRDSLFMHADSITDPNAAYLMQGGGHSEVWLSADAIAYRLASRDAAPETVDRLRFNAVDTAFLDTILAFFETAA